MQEIINLIEDYKRRIGLLESEIHSWDGKNEENIVRLSTKLFCYKTFIHELEQLKKEIAINC